MINLTSNVLIINNSFRVGQGLIILERNLLSSSNYPEIKSNRRLKMEQLVEQFKPIKDFEELYSISNYGYVISEAKEWASGIRLTRKKGKTILVGGLDGDGYPIVSLSKNGNKTTLKTHLLVWDHFGDSPRNGHKLQVDHIDENKLNPRIDNLQTLSGRENSTKYCRTQKHSSKYIGVRKSKCGNWRVMIHVNKKEKCMGTFKNEIDAANEYQRALKEFNETGKITINTPLMKRKASKYRGVCWSIRDKRWFARIQINKKIYSLGYFKKEYNAYLARKKGEKELL